MRRLHRTRVLCADRLCWNCVEFQSNLPAPQNAFRMLVIFKSTFDRAMVNTDHPRQRILSCHSIIKIVIAYEMAPGWWFMDLPPLFRNELLDRRIELGWFKWLRHCQCY